MYWVIGRAVDGGVTHKWLENGADMVVTDNSFETVKEDDVKKNSSGGGD